MRMTKVLVLLLPLVLCYGYCGGAFFFSLPGAAAFLIQLEDEEDTTTATSTTRTGTHHNEQQPQRRQLRPLSINNNNNNNTSNGFNFTGGINTEQPAEDEQGAPSLRKHIVNGYTVNQATNRYPYTVLLYRNDFDRFYCGGSLIAPDIVLTAAHCGSPTRVEIGRYDRGEAAAETPQYESRDVAYAYRHPHYDKPTYGYDLLLLKLVSPTFQKPPIKLNTQDPNVLLQNSPPQFVTVTGFGQTRHNGLPAPQLQYIDLNYISNGQCDQSRDPTSPRPEFQVGYVGMIQPDMLCLQDLSFSYKDACSGDSGGPAIVRGNTPAEDIQIGITSWGYECALPAFPGVYSNIYYNLEWIRSSVCKMATYNPGADFQCDRYNTNTDDTNSTKEVQPLMAITLQFDFAMFPGRISWAFTDGTTHATLMYRSPLAYTNIPARTQQYQEIVGLPAGSYLSYTIWSQGNNGLEAFSITYQDFDETEIVVLKGRAGGNSEHDSITVEFTLPSAPTQEPTPAPTELPSSLPTQIPTVTPSVPPTVVPSAISSEGPSTMPSIRRSSRPTGRPSSTPSAAPSGSPSESPSGSFFPSSGPTEGPTKSKAPSDSPSTKPSRSPSTAPSSSPSSTPSGSPSGRPSGSSSQVPTQHPSNSPTDSPTAFRTTKIPTSSPTFSPTRSPTIPPTTIPTIKPSPPTLEPTTTRSITKSPTFLLPIYPSSPNPTTGVVPTSLPSLKTLPTPNILLKTNRRRRKNVTTPSTTTAAENIQKGLDPTTTTTAIPDDEVDNDTATTTGGTTSATAVSSSSVLPSSPLASAVGIHQAQQNIAQLQDTYSQMQERMQFKFKLSPATLSSATPPAAGVASSSILTSKSVASKPNIMRHQYTDATNPNGSVLDVTLPVVSDFVTIDGKSDFILSSACPDGTAVPSQNVWLFAGVSTSCWTIAVLYL